MFIIHPKRLAVAVLRVVLTCLPLTSCGSPHFCDIDKQLSFLEVGPGIVGTWIWEGSDPKNDGPFVTFNEEGHLIHYRFGCGDALWPLEPGGMNTIADDLGYGERRMKEWKIEPGHFRLVYATNSATDWIEGTLVNNETLDLRASMNIFLRGTFVRYEEAEGGQDNNQERDDQNGQTKRP